MNERAARLPPLNALRVFQTVVRHRSFRAAAEELLVTPQAVSQQIKLLEDSLGQELFLRKGRAVEPNEQAILLAHYVQAGFDEMAEGVRRISKTATRNRINVNASPYFATRFLLDRLSHFRELMPDVDLRLTTMVNLPDFVRDDVDVAIQWGFGDWKTFDHALLRRDEKVICCTPDLAEKLHAPTDLAKVPLLRPLMATQLWGNVLAHLGVERSAQSGDMTFHDAATMRRATLAGLGVGLNSIIDAAEDLKTGKIVAPFGLEILQDMPSHQIPGFYLVLPKSHRRIKSIAAFCEWLVAENWASDDVEAR